MLETLAESQPEALLQISIDFAADTRTEKIDLGVGVYRNQQGQTHILNTVKDAEARLVEQQQTKSYVGLLGDTQFNKAISDLILGPQLVMDRLAVLQTPGGSAALRLLFELVKNANPKANLWLPDPSWANHLPTVQTVGLNCDIYPYYDANTSSLNFSAMTEALQKLSGNDVVLLHSCCHNPTGADLSADQWDIVADLAQKNGFIPLVDMAYHGFANGLNADAYGVRQLASKCPELLLAYSCSKNFAIYRERTGIALVQSKTHENAARALGQMKAVVRANYSMPPDHGAAVVRIILQDKSLRESWALELESIQQRIQGLRKCLANEFRRQTGSNHYARITQQNGIFSMLNLSPDQVQVLRDHFAIYMPRDGRINIAGLNESNVAYFVTAITSFNQEF
ncbi:MAG: aspartate aminotransferase [Parasphingorhabdus sp.]|jgi:aspartate aminotransferase